MDRHYNCCDIEITDEGTTVIANNDKGEQVIVPYGILEWRNPYKDGDDYDLPLFLTLREIGEQLLLKNYKPVFFVWHDMGLSGKIYRCGNYDDNSYWEEYGHTLGFA